jgi:hypothetical protein
LERDAPDGPGSSSVSSSRADADTSPALRAGVRPLLCLSGIHGDLWALESVLAEVKHLSLAGIVVAGDHCLGGDQPFEVWTRLCALGAHMVAGPSDIALGALSAGLSPTPRSAKDEERLAQFLRTKAALGDVVCRRLGDLPATIVVSLDDTSGVMVMHSSPQDDGRVLNDDVHLEDDVACVAEDILVCGGAEAAPFARRVPRPEPLCVVDDDIIDDAANVDDVPPPWEPSSQPLLVVNSGVVGSPRPRRSDGRQSADAVLLAPDGEGRVRAFWRRVLVMQKASVRAG